MLPHAAGREAVPGDGARIPSHQRPKCTLLYQLIEEYYPAFESHLAAQGTELPGYIRQEVGQVLGIVYRILPDI